MTIGTCGRGHLRWVTTSHHIVHGDCVQYWLHVSRGICTVVRGGAMRLGDTSALRKFGARACAAHAARVHNHWRATFEAVHPLALGLGHGLRAMGARITRGAFELVSYFRHECQEYPASPELATLYFL